MKNKVDFNTYKNILWIFFAVCSISIVAVNVFYNLPQKVQANETDIEVLEDKVNKMNTAIEVIKTKLDRVEKNSEKILTLLINQENQRR